MGFISAPVNLSSPAAIGSTTPNTGAFTTLSATPPANTTAFASTGFSLTGTNAQTLLNLAGTWNTSGTPTAIFLNVTDTSSNSASLLMDLQVGGSSQLKISKFGRITSSRSDNGAATISVLGGACGIASNASTLLYLVTSTSHIQNLVSSNWGFIQAGNLGSSGGYCFSTGATNTPDLILARDAANILAQRNSTSAQTFRLYRTYTDASNYERLGLLTTNTTRYTITSENAGTGSARSLEVSFYTSASDPTSTDITSGCFSVWKNSGTGTIKLWANDGGTMKSVALS